MEENTARDDACREYQSSLEDLTFNSKPHINMLTILAEENLHFAKDIVAIIEAQILKAPANEKLPVLYLVDSIVKNVGGEYLAVFAKNLITTFMCVFEKVDESTRKSLFKLRSTWDEVFLAKKLYALDLRVNSLDPAWPIKPLPPNMNNSSIHVNPRFLKQSDEPVSPTSTSPKPLSVTPPPQPAPTGTQSGPNQEQLIRQQLLAKQKQLLELQQKKIELELEQTKAQLAGGFTTSSGASASSSQPISKPVSQNNPVVRAWVPSKSPTDPKLPIRDPRLNRISPPSSVAPKDQQAPKKEGPQPAEVSAPIPEKKPTEKPVRLDKTRTLKKEAPEDKPTSLTPLVKNIPNKKTTEPPDSSKKDPRLKKRVSDSKEEDPKEKKKPFEKDEPRRSKPINGSMEKQDDNVEKTDQKATGNARTHARKRTRSRSPTSPKRKDHRSPKTRNRSGSLSPSNKLGKPRRPRVGNAPHVKSIREERLGIKKNQLEGRRSKRAGEDRHSESRDAPRSHVVGGKELKDAQHHWRSGWESKHLKPEDSHLKPGAQRHKSYNATNRVATARMPKHRLSVDADLQIPEVLNSASKKDLLRRASKRLESGEISQEVFLNMAHQIKHLFQYQEEKQQRSEGHDSDFYPQKGAPRPHMDAAQLSYYEHKSKLRKTQVSHRAAGEDMDGPGEISENFGHHQYARHSRDRLGEGRSKDHEQLPSGPMIEEYNHGKEFPNLKVLPGLRFRKKVDTSEHCEREWNSPLTERQLLDEQKSGYDAPRRFGPAAESRRPEALNPPGTDSLGPRFERERLSPLHQQDLSPAARFESPNSEHSDDGPLDVNKPILNPVQRVRPRSARPHSHSPAHTPPHDGGHPPFFMGPPRPRPPGWFEAGGPGRFEERPMGPCRFEGPPRMGIPDRPECDGLLMGRGTMVRFDGPMQAPNRFGVPAGLQPPVRFDGQLVEGPMTRFNMAPPGPMGFQPPRPVHFEEHVRFDGLNQPGHRFDHPNVPPQVGPPRLEYVPQGPPGFPPQHNLQPPMRPLGPVVYDNPMPPQPNFGMPPQCFPEPMNPQFPGGAMAFPSQPPVNFNIQPAPFFNAPQTVTAMPNQPFLPQSSVPFVQQNPQMVSQENQFRQVDVEDLVSKLISTGIITPGQPSAMQTPAEASTMFVGAPPPEEEEEEEQEEEDNIPDLTSFRISLMKTRYESVVSKLYSGNQCCLCSMRFTAAQTDLYADHLDWHFRQNHAGKMASKKVTHRRWYYGLRDWIEFEEIADLEDRAKSQFFEKENEEVQKNQAAAKEEEEVQCVRASKDQVAETCEICQEAFETYWVEEEEDWFLKNAIRVDEKNFHPSCFEDYNTSSFLDITPSPSRMLTEHPLANIGEKDIKEEKEVASCEAEEKQEVEVKEEPAVLSECVGSEMV